MTLLFMRSVEFYVDERLFNGDDFTVGFDIPFDDGSEANVSEIKIYNLNDETINRFKGNKSKIILNAGYKDDSGAVLLGLLKETKTIWTGPDKITTLQVLDGTDSWFSMPYKKTFAPGITAGIILGVILKETGLQIGAFNLPKNYVYKSGKTVNGKLKDIIKAISKDCGAKAHVTRGKIFIRPKNEGDNIGFVLDSKHGLISSPTTVEKDIETEQKDKDGNKIKVKRYGWNVKTLLNHRITTDALLQITSKTANGIFRVESGKHSSDGAGAYYTEMEVYPV